MNLQAVNFLSNKKGICTNQQFLIKLLKRLDYFCWKIFEDFSPDSQVGKLVPMVKSCKVTGTKNRSWNWKVAGNLTHEKRNHLELYRQRCSAKTETKWSGVFRSFHCWTVQVHDPPTASLPVTLSCSFLHSMSFIHLVITQFLNNLRCFLPFQKYCFKARLTKICSLEKTLFTPHLF